jgi:hypothetical protein
MIRVGGTYGFKFRWVINIGVIIEVIWCVPGSVDTSLLLALKVTINGRRALLVSVVIDVELET